MVAKNLFRPRQPRQFNNDAPSTSLSQPTTCEEKLAEYEEQLTHLSQQKELHTLALREMYQFLCKLDASFREENQKLKDMIEIEQARSAKLIEVTKGLWDIIELMDDGRPGPVDLAEELTREVRALANMEVEISDESETSYSDKFPSISEIAPMLEAVG